MKHLKSRRKNGKTSKRTLTAWACTAIGGTLLFCGGSVPAATPDNLGVSISVQPYVEPAWIDNGYDPSVMTTYRVYASLSGGTQLLSVYGDADDPMIIGDRPMTFYTADPIDSNQPPQDLMNVGIWFNQRDSYVTITATNADDDETQLFGDFPTLDGSFTSDNAGWTITPADTPLGTGPLVLIAQITTYCDPPFFGQLNLGLAGGQQVRGVAFGPAAGFQVADLNNDFLVDVADLLICLDGWGPGCGGDVNFDGQTNVGDILLIFANWTS